MNILKNNPLLFPLALVLYEITVYASNDMYLPAILQMQHDFNTTPELAQATVTAFVLGSSFMQVIVGLLSDKIGRRPVLLVSAMVFVFATVLCALVNDINSFLVTRFIQGSVISGIFSAGYAAIHELLETKQAIKTLAWMYSITILAPGLGPLAGSGLLLLFDSWRHLFWLLAIMGAAATCGLFFTMPETLNSANSNNKNIITAKFSNYIEILKNTTFLRYVIISSCFTMVMVSWITTGPVVTKTAFKLNENYFGIFQAIIFGCFILGTKMVPRFTETKTPLELISFGTNLSAAIILPLITYFVFLFTNINLNYLLIPALSLSAFCGGLTGSSLQRLAIDSSQYGSGAKMAVFSTITGIAMTLGSVIVTSFYDSTIKPIAFLTIGAIFVIFILSRNLKDEQNG